MNGPCMLCVFVLAFLLMNAAQETKLIRHLKLIPAENLINLPLTESVRRSTSASKERKVSLMSAINGGKTRPTPKVDREIDELCESLDRSRKRHLEVGLLRGDRVHDHLKVQEESASPQLKKNRFDSKETTPPSIKMAMTMADFKAYMEENSNKRFDKLEGSMDGISAAVKKVEVAVEANTEKIDQHDVLIREIRQDLDAVKAKRTTSGSSWASVTAATTLDRPPTIPPERDSWPGGP